MLALWKMLPLFKNVVIRISRLNFFQGKFFFLMTDT